MCIYTFIMDVLFRSGPVWTGVRCGPVRSGPVEPARSGPFRSSPVQCTWSGPVRSKSGAAPHNLGLFRSKLQPVRSDPVCCGPNQLAFHKKTVHVVSCCSRSGLAWSGSPSLPFWSLTGSSFPNSRPVGRSVLVPLHPCIWCIHICLNNHVYLPYSITPLGSCAVHCYQDSHSSEQGAFELIQQHPVPFSFRRSAASQSQFLDGILCFAEECIFFCWEGMLGNVFSICAKCWSDHA